jgi:Arc/MetJ-type ribon-helix-helix transcriptional regulator
MINEDDGNMRRVTVTLPQALVDVLHDMAEDSRISVSEAVREALHHYLFNERWKPIGELAQEQIKAGKTNQEVLEIVKGKYPGASTSLGSISWYRSKLRRTDPSVPTDRQAREQRN